MPRMFFHSGAPLYLTFFVTGRCDSRCATCFNWKRLKGVENDLTLEEIEKFTAKTPDLLWLSLSGGEPFLRNDLPGVVETFIRNTNPRHITINTNGIRTKQICEMSEKILVAAKNKCFVNINVSIDGIAGLHDEIRGVPGNFEAAAETFDFLKSLKTSFPDFGAGISTTFSYYNRKTINELKDYVIREMKPDHWDLSYVRGEPRTAVSLDADPSGFEAVKTELDRMWSCGEMKYYDFPLSGLILARDRLLTRLLTTVLKENRYVIPCYAGSISSVIMENGDVLACEMLPAVIGNLRASDYDPVKILKSRAAADIKDEIRKTKCFCTHECNLAINILFNPLMYPKLIMLVPPKRARVTSTCKK
jgi:MoaA/NifB/PqqE/SkfB family radical SAM enzyme